MKLKILIIFSILYFSHYSFAQGLTQSIKGKVVDAVTQKPLPYANIVILGLKPSKGTITDKQGSFLLENIPIGRYDIEVSFLGYTSIIKPEIVLTPAKTVELIFELVENSNALDVVVIKPKVIKNKPINIMATVSSRMLSVEEANRYAGGFNDPARLAASFPGVSSGIGNNAIVIRGNAPKSLQWKLEGIEIPNPNHFADLGAFGGGGLTALSSNLLANSDFYTGAFPAEYNNALSGVFDIRMRNGNNTDFEHTVEVGAIGIDIASEGPLNKKTNASYLFNYRYSTLELISSLLPDNRKGTDYQDLSFKFKFPTKKIGTFSLWGIGLLDTSGNIAEVDITKQEFINDLQEQDISQYMAALGLNHRYLFKNDIYINSTLAISGNGIEMETKQLDNNALLTPENKINNDNYYITLKSFINKRFNKNHVNRTGFSIRGIHYNSLFKENRSTDNELETLVDEKGFSTLLSAYSNSSITHNNWKFNIGINSQFFTLNNDFTIEPRIGIKYAVNQTSSLQFGYGLHSRLEPLNIYLSNTTDAPSTKANKNLDISKSHHFVLAYDLDLSKKTHLKIEPYFQYLYDIPSIKGSTVSLSNLQYDFFENRTFINSGKGRNYGIDLTLEQYLNRGFYYLISASLFNSEYKTDTNEWYNTRFNKNFLFNFLIGKEFRLGKRKENLLGLNLRVSYQGGNRHSLIDEEASAREQDVIFNENTPFTEQIDPSLFTYLTINYAWYKKKINHRISLKMLNVNGHKEYLGHRFNLIENKPTAYKEAIVIPNISYRISF
ncbi:TonB-dependent receptor [Aquimarina rhabdastrellae]